MSATNEKDRLVTPDATDANYTDPPPDYANGADPKLPLYSSGQPYPVQPHPVAVPPVTYITTNVRPVFLDIPVSTHCAFCNTDIITNVEYEAGLLTWMSCGIILLFGGWLGCCLIPFCIKSCKDVVHTCPNCRAMVGKYNRVQ